MKKEIQTNKTNLGRQGVVRKTQKLKRSTKIKGKSSTTAKFYNQVFDI